MPTHTHVAQKPSHIPHTSFQSTLGFPCPLMMSAIDFCGRSGGADAFALKFKMNYYNA